MAVRPLAIQQKRGTQSESIFDGVRQDRKDQRVVEREQARAERDAARASWNARCELLEKRVVIIRADDPRFGAFFNAYDRARGTFAAQFNEERNEWAFAVRVKGR